MFVCDQKFSAHGADVARLWAAGSDFYKDISVGPNIMKQFQENFRKVSICANIMLLTNFL